MKSVARRILIVGRSGQLALSLAALNRPGLTFVGRPEIDLGQAASLGAAVARATPDIVINTGAYTFVDKAESEPAAAFAINRDGPAELARVCSASGIPLMHISTDCVFDGLKTEPYEPHDLPAPLSVYGESKWQGEQAVAEHAPRHVIVRVSWLFSEFGGNFVRTMLELARKRHEVTVVSDQWGYPTYCPDLAAGLFRIADAACAPGFDGWGTYHLAGDEDTDRAEMARRIYAESAALGGPVASVRAVPTSDYPTAAKRPLNARLESRKAIDTFGLTMPSWGIGLGESVRKLVAESGEHAGTRSNQKQG